MTRHWRGWKRCSAPPIPSIGTGQRPRARLGRYAGDKYYSGGAYYFATLGGGGILLSQLAMLAKGDAYLETVRAFTPESGDLSEQFDQITRRANIGPASGMELCRIPHRCCGAASR